MYSNVEVKHVNSDDGATKKIVREVHIENGKGYKKVTKYVGGKKQTSVRRTIKKDHIRQIEKGCFVPGLFSDCEKSTKHMRKTHKHKRT